MKSDFGQDRAINWKPFISGMLTGFVLIAIVFALPLKTISTETTETYYVTEMRQESYVATEPYVTEEVYEKTVVFADGFYKVVPAGVIIPFYSDRHDARLVGKFENPVPGSFVIFNEANRIIWEIFGSQSSIDLPIPQGQYRARFQENIMWGEDCYIYLALKWSETQQVTKYKEVTKYRQVPVQVEKQRTLTEKNRISIWQQIFE